jgi:hypothetical protein
MPRISTTNEIGHGTNQGAVVERIFGMKGAGLPQKVAWSYFSLPWKRTSMRKVNAKLVG